MGDGGDQGRWLDSCARARGGPAIHVRSLALLKPASMTPVDSLIPE